MAHVHLFEDGPRLGSYEANLVSKTAITSPSYESAEQAHVRYGQKGETIQITTKEARRYHLYKNLVLLSELLICCFYVLFAVAAYILAYVENEVGSGWLIGDKTMKIVTPFYALLGIALHVMYVVTAVLYSKNGDLEIDDLVASGSALGTMFCVCLYQLIKYFFIGEKDNSTCDFVYRRNLYVIFFCSGILSCMVILGAISRHAVYYREVILAGYHGLQDSQDGGQVVHQISWKHGGSNIIYVVAYTISSVVIVVISIVIGSIGLPSHFETAFFSLTLIMVVNIVFLTTIWVLWTFSSEGIRGGFVAHFDTFYLSQFLFTCVIVSLLGGYYVTYSAIAPDYFGSSDALHTLKGMYWGKIAMFIWVLCPVTTMAISKGSYVMSTEYPIDHKKYT